MFLLLFDIYYERTEATFYSTKKKNPEKRIEPIFMRYLQFDLEEPIFLFGFNLFLYAENVNVFMASFFSIFYIFGCRAGAPIVDFIFFAEINNLKAAALSYGDI